MEPKLPAGQATVMKSSQKKKMFSEEASVTETTAEDQQGELEHRFISLTEPPNTESPSDGASQPSIV